MAKDPDTSVVDQYIERAALRIDEPEQLANFFLALNIGSFALDFTGCFCRQLRHGSIHAVLPLTTYRNVSAF
jgi:hypothetical protein